ncbi:MAG: hypothetical protein KBT11_11090 [Treponema sp.]|nr:hypothetical protein [Candidatus Treponema equifaecale]
MEFIKELLGINTKISVFAFYGPSGTGKSFRAKLVAQKYGIKVIIDDGLLIQDDEILAGRSAKLEKNYMGAVRVALFDDKEHRDSVARAIVYNKIKKIMILGTSEKMVNKIAMRLQLPLPEKYVRIEDIATPEQMEEARRSRQIEGKHVIPVRAYEVKDRTYSKIFVKSIRVSLARRKFIMGILEKLLGVKKSAPSQNTKLFEKSVVSPSFSRTARKDISHAVLARMTSNLINGYNSRVRVKKLSVRNSKAGYIFALVVDLPMDCHLTQMSQELKNYVIQMIEKESGMFIEEIYIVIDKLLPPVRQPELTA